MQKLKSILSKLIEGSTGKRVAFWNPASRPTASLSDLGFWYAGNVFDASDIAHGISQNGLVESDETALVISILDLIKKEKGFLSFYDIGANTGYYGILAGFKYGTETRVNSFEPIVSHMETLKQSILLNRLDGIIMTHQIALGNGNSEEIIYVAGSGTSLSQEFIQGQYKSTQKITVRKLDDLIAEGKISDMPHFVKIDVEGHEKAVLEGSKKTVAASRPVLYIEIAQTLKGLGRPGFSNAEYIETFKLLEGLGYDAFMQENGSISKFDPATSFDGVRMYLFLHKDEHNFIKAALKI